MRARVRPLHELRIPSSAHANIPTLHVLHVRDRCTCVLRPLAHIIYFVEPRNEHIVNTCKIKGGENHIITVSLIAFLWGCKLFCLQLSMIVVLIEGNLESYRINPISLFIKLISKRL